MHRVLSFQVGRNIAETSEFVTKRLCCSFIFSIGFLCLLGGFLLGQFAAERALQIREEKQLRQLGSNGLEAARRSEQTMLRYLNGTDLRVLPSLARADLEEDEEDRQRSQILAELESRGRPNETSDTAPAIARILNEIGIFQLNVVVGKKATFATICGSVEPDRYIVLSAKGETGLQIAYHIAKAFDVVNGEEREWRPRRTLVFCVFYDDVTAMDPCYNDFLDRIKPKIVAYIAIHEMDRLEGSPDERSSAQIMVSGSSMLRATTLEALEIVKNFYRKTAIERAIAKTNSTLNLPRLRLDPPHVILSYYSDDLMQTSTEDMENAKKALTQIIALTMLRLSEELFFRWNPQYFSQVIYELINSIRFPDSREHLNATVTKLINEINKFNSKLDEMNVLRALDVRIINDRLLDFERAMTCPDDNLTSKTDLFGLKKSILQDNITNRSTIGELVNQICDCYEEARTILEDLTECQKIFSNFEKIQF